MTTHPTCIIAYIGEGEHFAAVSAAALETARSSNARLILYDVDAASPFGKPLPTNWSAGGAQDQVPSRLTVADLEHAGRHELAEQVQAAIDSGIDAFGWLPGDRSGESLATYAKQQQADLLMLPRELQDPGILDRLRGRSLHDVEEHTHRTIALVDLNGDVEMTGAPPREEADN